jgi:hypothetical protein
MKEELKLTGRNEINFREQIISKTKKGIAIAEYTYRWVCPKLLINAIGGREPLEYLMFEVERRGQNSPRIRVNISVLDPQGKIYLDRCFAYDINYDTWEEFEEDIKTMIHNIASTPDTFKKFILDLWPVENGKKGRNFEFSNKLVTTLSESKTDGMRSLSSYVMEKIDE